MDITEQNFKENFQVFRSSLNQSDFIAIDAEFSGLYNKLRLNPLDEFSERYELLRKNLKQYMLLQVGICCYERVAPGEYTCSPFNFNIFPYNCDQSKDFNTAFLCDSNTLAFLAENRFDFNKTIYHGVPFVTMTNLKSLIRQKSIHSSEMELISQCVSSQISEDLRSKKRALSPEADPLPADQSAPELTTDTEDFDKLLIMTSFNQIIHLISQYQKPTVFHNGYLDLFHLMNQFYGPLPDKWDDFKTMVHRVFPRIYDTKYLACIDPFREHIDQSSLAAVYEKLCPKFPINLTFPPTFERYIAGADYQHEAGYDAMITGHIFASMQLLVAKLDKFVNEIFLGLQGVFHFSPTKRDTRPQRDNVLHVSTKSQQDKISKEEITDLLSPYSGVYNFWFHNSSVFVMLRKSLKKVDLLNLRTSTVHTKYHIMSYEEYYNSKRKIGCSDAESFPKRNKNCGTKPQNPKFHSKYSVDKKSEEVFPNVDDWSN